LGHACFINSATFGPNSASNTRPVTSPDSSLASQTTIGATQRGLRRLISSPVRSLNPSVIRVCARGAMALTVIPYCLSSVALMMVKAAMPAFAAPACVTL